MKFQLLILSVINYISLTNTQNICNGYKCVDNLSPICKKKEEAKPIIDLQACPDDKMCVGDEKVGGTCIPKDYSTLQFPGANCNEDNDCINKKCVDKKCKLSDPTKCSSDNDCNIGSFCIEETSTCSVQLEVGKECKNHDDCVNTAGCFNKKCVNYFSLEDGSKVDDNKYAKFLCKSGMSLDNFCFSGKLKSNNFCTATGICTYNLNNGTEYNSTSACVCGNNENGDKVCKYGTDSTQFKNLVDLYKSYFNTNNTSCHTTERFLPCASSAFDLKGNNTYNNFYYQRNMRKFHNNILLNDVKFFNTSMDNCIYTVLGYDNRVINPVNSVTCPKYNCGSEKACARSTNPNNVDSSNITLTLTKGVCNADQTCAIGRDLNKIYSFDNVDFKCDTLTVGSKYPGEKCSSNNECNNKNCTANVCNFQKLGDVCSNSDFSLFCGVGAFCSTNTTTSTSTCVTQKEREENCTSFLDCKNNLACYNKTCSLEFGTLEENFTFDESLFDGNFKEFNRLCKSLEYSSTKKKCISYSYNDTADSNGFVSCNVTPLGEECKYTTNFNETLKKNCNCGYNADGKSYCPVDFSKRKINY